MTLNQLLIPRDSIARQNTKELCLLFSLKISELQLMDFGRYLAVFSRLERFLYSNRKETNSALGWNARRYYKTRGSAA